MAFTLSPQPLARRINAAWPAPRALGVEGDLAGLPQGEGLPDMHREYSGCSPAAGRTRQGVWREQSNSCPDTREKERRKNLPRPGEGDAERSARAGAGGAGHAHEV